MFVVLAGSIHQIEAVDYLGGLAQFKLGGFGAVVTIEAEETFLTYQGAEARLREVQILRRKTEVYEANAALAERTREYEAAHQRVTWAMAALKAAEEAG